MTDFTIYPAIDLRAGQVVRLAEGDPNRQTVYGSDPAAWARRWLGEHARWLHVVNLDGAFGDTDAANRQAVRTILAVADEFGAAVQFGGGLRTVAMAADVLALGVRRVVIGTAAVTEPALLDALLAEYGPERIAVGIDVRDGRVRIRGWAEGSAVTATALAQRVAGQGVTTVVFTDVARDGLGTGVNVSATAALAESSGLQVIASGGIHTPADIQAVKAAGLPGVIVGRALYEGTVQLAQFD